MNNPLNAEEESAAIVMASLGKRKMDDPDEAAGGFTKQAREFREEDEAQREIIPPLAPQENGETIGDSNPQEVDRQDEIKPYPFFYYVDYSTEPDPDPFTPLVPPGRVPNFPSKMHAILAREDLKEMISWLPHGRAWKVCDSKEFEKRVLPKYFDHAKYSSFVRQANGWGFRRISIGNDRNAYYHPRFLRGLPHLCKDMKRPGVSKKVVVDPDHEPDLASISELHPVPIDAAPDESIYLHCTVQNGPKARMPIYTGSYSSLRNPSLSSNASVLAPSDHEFLSTFQNSLCASEQQLNSNSGPVSLPAAPMATQAVSEGLPSTNLVPLGDTSEESPAKISSLSTANQFAFINATAQFAAGFAAAMDMFQRGMQASSDMTNEPFVTMAAGMSSLPDNNSGDARSHTADQHQTQIRLPPTSDVPTARNDERPTALNENNESSID